MPELHKAHTVAALQQKDMCCERTHGAAPQLSSKAHTTHLVA